MSNNGVNYGKAVYSVAMIDFNSYIETLLNLDEELREPNRLLTYVFDKTEINDDLKDMINDLALSKFAKVKKYLKDVQNSIVKYQNKLEEFLNSHSQENQEFYEVLNVLIPLWEEKEKYIVEQIDLIEYLIANPDARKAIRIASKQNIHGKQF